MAGLMLMIVLCFGGPTVLALLASGRWRDPRAIGWAAAATGTAMLNLLTVSLAPAWLPAGLLPEGLQWNWSGKAAAIVLTLAIWVVLPAAMRAEAGLATRPAARDWRSVAAVCAAMLAFFWGAAYGLRDGSPLTAEYLAFQAVMPSLDEEFAYRGTVAAMLAAAFGRPHTLAGVRTGWGALPIVTFFGLMHGAATLLGDEPVDLPALAATVLVTGVAGAGLLWLKEATGSVWPCVATHSLMNLGSGVVNQLPP